jgi:hypothetical protein
VDDSKSIGSCISRRRKLLCCSSSGQPLIKESINGSRKILGVGARAWRHAAPTEGQASQREQTAPLHRAHPSRDRAQPTTLSGGAPNPCRPGVVVANNGGELVSAIASAPGLPHFHCDGDHHHLAGSTCGVGLRAGRDEGDHHSSAPTR